jgi:hypothetical protein
MKVYTRVLTWWAARACEQAKKPICTCRCGGALHGKSHDGFIEAVNGLLNRQGDITDDEIQEILEDLGNAGS